MKAISDKDTAFPKSVKKRLMQHLANVHVGVFRANKASKKLATELMDKNVEHERFGINRKGNAVHEYRIDVGDLLSKKDVDKLRNEYWKDTHSSPSFSKPDRISSIW